MCKIKSESLSWSALMKHLDVTHLHLEEKLQATFQSGGKDGPEKLFFSLLYLQTRCGACRTLVISVTQDHFYTVFH